jgi:hypothetical protein
MVIKMEQELVSVDDKTQKIKVFGIEVVYMAKDLHIYVDGVDVLQQMLYDKILVTAEIHRIAETTAQTAPQTPASLK